jgi:uncharacterized protein YpmB
MNKNVLIALVLILIIIIVAFLFVDRAEQPENEEDILIEEVDFDLENGEEMETEVSEVREIVVA